MSNQTTSNILMVRPAHFGYNAETAESNAFQSEDTTLTPNEISQRATQEFDAFTEKLQAVGIHVFVVEDTPDPVKPDAIFPNNWVTFHEDGTVVTYPMLSNLRRLERRSDVLKELGRHFRINRKIQLEEYENVDRILEGTGSLILDRQHKLAYACLSPRTSDTLLNRFCEIMGYEAVTFHSVDENGQEIYHTNVMMALGETFVVICLDTVQDEEERQLLISKFEQTNKEVIEITYEQMMHFAGNMLQVRNEAGETYLVMSEQAYQSLTEEQIDQIEAHTNILHASIPTIETFGGGSVRCMMAEVFLEKSKH